MTDLPTGSRSSLPQDGSEEYAPIEVPPPPPAIQSFDGSGPRLIITKIVNENFKSYAGRQTLGPFHKNFTCIIGPNGSGKSNVIDSMLFVFGYRASKIRSKKLSVLIHNSEMLTNVESCTVEVHFQKIIDTGPGDLDYDIVPDSEFTVARSAFRDNTNTYQINGWRKSIKEVTTLLKGHGIDLEHNRFLILQGEVEQIALMKPKAPSAHEDGLLEYLEDIIGSSRFKEPTERLVKRIEELNELRQEQLNRVKVVEREKAELEEVRNEAVDYLRRCNEVVKKKNGLYQTYILECIEKEIAIDKRKTAVDEKLVEQADAVSKLEANRIEKERTNVDVVSKWQEILKTNAASKERFTELEAEDTRLRDEYKHLKASGKRAIKNLDQEKQKVEELTKVPEEAAARTEDLTNRIAKLSKVKAKEDTNYEEAMSSLQEETQEMRRKKEAKEVTLNAVQAETSEKQAALEIAKSQLSNLRSQFSREERKLFEAQSTLESTETALENKKQSIATFAIELPKMQASLAQSQKDLGQVREHEETISAEVRQLRGKLQESKSAFESHHSNNQVLNALMEQKTAGKIPGILGRLGDLGGIGERYDVAMSTACGPLDNIVTDTIDTAQKCVQFLKRFNVGHATFIGLDKMERWRAKSTQKITTPENVPRLFDLIEINDPRIAPAFYYALRDTLVAENLEQATRIAYGATRFRVVTLQGQLIETSGAMTGGGGRVQRGRMGKTARRSEGPGVDKEAVARLETSLAERAGAAEKLKENRVRLEELSTRLEREVKDVKKNYASCKSEVCRLENQITSLTELVHTTEQRMKAVQPDPKKVTALENEVTSLTAVYTKAAEKSTALQEEVDTLHNAIMDLGGSKLSAVQSRLTEVTNTMKQLETQLTKIGVSVKSAERNLVKCRERCEKFEQEIEDLKIKLNEVSERLAEEVTEAKEMMAKFEDGRTEANALQKQVDKAKAEIEACETAEQEAKKIVAELKHDLSLILEELDETLKRIRHWKKEIGKLKLHSVPGQEDEDADHSQTVIRPLPTYNPDELKDMNISPVMITDMEDEIKALKPNMAAIEEFRRKEEVYLNRVSELERFTSLREAQRRQHEQFKRQRLEEFMSGFSTITGRLKEMYQMITLGGDAELELVDSLDPFSEGIVFSVRPPNKSWKNISNLSGGEKTLSSLALVFALHHYKPTPLYVMDEIDAALDFKNVSIVANYVKECTQNAQFVIISLRSNMFELANQLVGIYKTFNCTKTVTVKPGYTQSHLKGNRPTVAPAARTVSTENEPANGPVATQYDVGIGSQTPTQSQENDSPIAMDMEMPTVKEEPTNPPVAMEVDTVSS